MPDERILSPVEFDLYYDRHMNSVIDSNVTLIVKNFRGLGEPGIVVMSEAKYSALMR